MKRQIGDTLPGQYLFVHKCAGCGRILRPEERREAFCPACLLRYRAGRVESCPRCFRSAWECRCMPSELARAGMLCLRKAVFYHSEKQGEPQNQIIYRLKQSPNRRMAEFLAKEILGAIEEELRILGYDGELGEVRLMGLPRSRRSRNRYGFDQASFIAGVIGEKMAIPCVSAIGRRWGGREQKKLGSRRRLRNIRHSFFLTKEGAEVSGRCVILFDDVVTTGASMAACTKLLREAGATAVIGVCVGQNKRDQIGKRTS